MLPPELHGRGTTVQATDSRGRKGHNLPGRKRASSRQRMTMTCLACAAERQSQARIAAPHLDRRASSAKRLEGMRYYRDSHGNGRWDTLDEA